VSSGQRDRQALGTSASTNSGFIIVATALLNTLQMRLVQGGRWAEGASETPGIQIDIDIEGDDDTAPPFAYLATK
jgi:hypothetical protein